MEQDNILPEEAAEKGVSEDEFSNTRLIEESVDDLLLQIEEAEKEQVIPIVIENLIELQRNGADISIETLEIYLDFIYARL